MLRCMVCGPTAGFFSPCFRPGNFGYDVKQQHKTLLVWLALFVAVLGLAKLFNNSQEIAPRSYSEFIEDVQRGEFKDTALDIEVHPTHVLIAYEEGGKGYEVVGPVTDELYKSLDKERVNYRVEPDEDSDIFMQMLLVGLPMLLIVVIMVMFMRQMQAGGGKAMSFGKSRARLLNEHQTKITFKDVAGNRRGPRRGRRDHRLLARHPEVSPRRRAHPQGRALDGPSRDGKNAAGAGHCR